MSRLINPWVQHDGPTSPYAGGTVFFGLPNEDPITNPKAPFSDSALQVPIGESQTLDSKGMYQTAIYLKGAYSMSLFDSDNNFVRTDPDVRGALTTGDGNVLAFSTLLEAVGSTEIVEGNALNLADRIEGNGGGAMWETVLLADVTPDTFRIVECTGIDTLAIVLREAWFHWLSKHWGAVADGIADDTLALKAMIDFSAAQTRHFAVRLSVGTHLISDQGGGFGLAIDSIGMTFMGEGNLNSSIKYLDAGPAIIGSSDGSTLREFITIRNLLLTSNVTTANSAIDVSNCPGAKLEDILILDYQDGVVAGSTWNSSCTNVQVKTVARYAFDLQSNTNGMTLQNCVGVTNGAAGSRCVRMNSSHGISIQGGAYEDAEFAFDIAACEVTFDTYVEGCTDGVITGSASNTLINIVNLYSFNNAESLPLFTMSGGFIQIQQMVDSPGVSTVSGSVFALTGGAKALYGIMSLNSATVIGSFDPASAGYIRPMNPAPYREVISKTIDSSLSGKSYMAKLFRPWKIHSIDIVKLGGTINGDVITIGNTTDPDSIAKYTTTDSDFQSLPFETSPTEGIYQTSGTYTNQTSFIFINTSGAGASGTYQIVVRLFSSYNGSSSLPNINDVDAFIDAENGGDTPITIQFTD